MICKWFLYCLAVQDRYIVLLQKIFLNVACNFLQSKKVERRDVRYGERFRKDTLPIAKLDTR